MIRFARKCSRDPKSQTKADHKSLRQHGLNQSEIMEIIAMSAFAVYANIMADATVCDGAGPHVLYCVKPAQLLLPVSDQFLDQRTSQAYRAVIMPRLSRSPEGRLTVSSSL